MENRTILIFDFENDYSVNDPTEITRHDHQKNCFVAHGDEATNIVQVGIEDLYLQRKDYGQSDDMTDGNNISLRYASNCWVTGVESGKCSKNHINATESQHLYISGCFFHDSWSHGDGGYGYGTCIEKGSEYCLIENNVFYRLRHAMLFIML